MSSSPLPIDRSREIVPVSGPHINDLGGSEEPPRWWPCIRNALAVLATVFTLGLAYILFPTIRSYVDMTFTIPQPVPAQRAPLPPAGPATRPQGPPAAAVGRPQAPARLFVVPDGNRFQGQTSEDRKALFRDTLQAVDHGYRVGSVVVTPDRDLTVRETESFRGLQPLGPNGGAGRAARFVVSQKTTTQAVLDLARGGVKPLALNMAHSHVPGGGVKAGCTAQEECMCRETSLYRSLEAHKSKGSYPIPEDGGIYSRHVEVLRDPTKGFAFLEKSAPCAFVSVAAPDLRDGCSERLALGLPLNGHIDQQALQTNEAYKALLKEKIVQLLRKAVLEGHTHLVLGALGCGAFEGSPMVTARLFHEVLNSDEFRGRFVHVEFAIYCAPGSRRDAANLAAFEQFFGRSSA
ncbi:MAG: TIGR02452 family protein [Verrucomicrobia bacterium]|nr:TIGR02452 family protein [Verrucomicrobiota bacterium]